MVVEEEDAEDISVQLEATAIDERREADSRRRREILGEFSYCIEE